ncbi:hypothetical protein RRG08_008327 [Elysia crispata]|uniref:Uncharacterized protein n=1 Tax=Elysia crispata TaxID=231223 RepID=A0AAE1A7N2_9GAST|nr:hypothetical protein RRG08_008327 [Elysia crispata]
MLLLSIPHGFSGALPLEFIKETFSSSLDLGRYKQPSNTEISPNQLYSKFNRKHYSSEIVELNDIAHDFSSMTRENSCIRYSMHQFQLRAEF